MKEQGMYLVVLSSQSRNPSSWLIEDAPSPEEAKLEAEGAAGALGINGPFEYFNVQKLDEVHDRPIIQLMQSGGIEGRKAVARLVHGTHWFCKGSVANKLLSQS